MRSEVTLARAWEQADPEGWMLSEKYDGVRALWDGSEFVTRNGRVLDAPWWMRAGMPAGLVLDGELWLGRGRFQELAGMLRRKDGDWLGVRFMVFDVQAPGDWAERMATLPKLPDQCELVEQVRCESLEHFEEYAARVVAAGGEGVVLRNDAAEYEAGRSWNLCKWKPEEEDEFEVVAPVRGARREVAALMCRGACGEFKVAAGLTAEVRADPPVGKQVTVRFTGRTGSGKPRDAVLVAVRDYE